MIYMIHMCVLFEMCVCVMCIVVCASQRILKDVLRLWFEVSNGMLSVTTTKHLFVSVNFMETIRLSQS